MKDRSMRSILAITVLALISSTSLGLTPALAADSSTSPLCGPDAPEGYKRPGGYCEQIGTNSLASSDSQGTDESVFVDGPEDQ